MRLFSAHPARRVASVAVFALLAVAMGGCNTVGMNSTGPLPASADPGSEADWRREVDAWGERYRANSQDPDAAIRYARALRATGQRSQALAVLEQASIRSPKNKALLGAYGRALAETGNYDQALDVFTRAHTPDQPEWKILSAQGAVLDEMGRHDQAQRHYASALKIMPDDPSVLSNLGLSYALSKDLPRAEATLRRAAARPGADSRVRQNLALVVGLQGRFAEAESIARADLPAAEAAANVAYVRQMLAQRSEVRGPGTPSSRSGNL
jgi:Flp pilus assembly protein TadD